MTDFNPLTGIAGGILIGLAADVLLLYNGDIMGASGIASSTLVHPVKAVQDASQYWKLVFIATFLSLTSFLLAPHLDWVNAVAAGRPLSAVAYTLGGFLVGFGTKLGSGCTSGHGICGLGRLSRRSAAAVVTFMTTGVITATLTRTDSYLARPFLQGTKSTVLLPTGRLLTFVSLALVLAAPFFHQPHTSVDVAKLPAAIASAALFAAGLFVSQMVVPARTFNFLDMTGLANGSWDPTLTLVMGAGFVLSFLAYQFVDGHSIVKHTKAIRQPLGSKSEFSVPCGKVIDSQLIGGAAMFGIGWGIAGFCPAPAIFLAGLGVPNVIFEWWPAFLVGSFLAEEYKKRHPSRCS